MADKAWKAAERRVARLLGAERNPLSGGNSGRTRSDSTHDTLFIETKQRTKHAVWAVWEDAREKAKKEGKVAVVALDQKRKHGCILCVHSDDVEAFALAVLEAKSAAAGDTLLDENAS